MSKEFFTTSFLPGTIVFIHDGYHEKAVPHLIVNCDDSEYGFPYLGFKITSRNKSNLNKYGFIPFNFDGKTSFISIGNICEFQAPTLKGGVVAKTFIMKELVDICLHMYVSRFGMYDRKKAEDEIDEYLEYYYSLNVPFRNENNDRQDIRKYIETTIEPDNAPTVVNTGKRAKALRLWSVPELIAWTNDIAKMSVEEVGKKYGIKSKTSVYNKNTKIKKELESRGISVK